jgi:hypothetical protein
MYCQECGKESQPGEVICSSCGGALTDAELDLPEVVAFPGAAGDAAHPSAAPNILDTSAEPLMPLAPPLPEAANIGAVSQSPHLEVAVGGLTGTFPLNRAVILIGRADPTTGHRPDVDLSMDAAVSRRHAEIRGGPGSYRIFDLGSTNGTVVNGAQIPRQQEVPLKDGDEIRVGENCKLTFRL